MEQILYLDRDLKGQPPFQNGGETDIIFNFIFIIFFHSFIFSLIFRTVQIIHCSTIKSIFI